MTEETIQALAIAPKPLLPSCRSSSAMTKTMWPTPCSKLRAQSPRPRRRSKRPFPKSWGTSSVAAGQHTSSAQGHRQDRRADIKRVGEAVDCANSAINSLTDKSSPAMPDDVTGALLHQEVRSALLRMDDTSRRKAITNAISSGDETFLAAATSGSPTLSGMTAVEQSAVREQWRKRRHPDAAARITKLRNAISQMDRLGSMLTKWSEGLVDQPSTAAVAAAEQSAVEATRAAS